MFEVQLIELMVIGGFQPYIIRTRYTCVLKVFNFTLVISQHITVAPNVSSEILFKAL